MPLFYEDGSYYLCRIEDWMIGKSKTKGTPCLNFALLVLAKKDRGQVEEVNQNKREVVMYFTENTIDSAFGVLRMLGYPHDTFDELERSHPNAFDFEGKEVECKCKHEDFTNNAGKTTTHEKWEFALRSPAVAKIEKKEISGLNAMFGSRIKGLKAPAPAASQANGPANRTPAAKPGDTTSAASRSPSPGSTLSTEQQAEELF